MISRTFAASSVIALLIGVGQRFMLTYAWALEVGLDPLPHWLHTHGVASETIGYALIIISFFADVVLSLPAAWILLTLVPRRRLIYLMLAVLPCFIYFDAYLQWQLGLGWDLALALIDAKVLLTLPLATWLLGRFIQPRVSVEVPQIMRKQDAR
jgi:hypothetical protein